MSTVDLYESDFAAWAERNAELLRAGRFSEVDLENVAEEIEDLARRQGRELRRRLARLLEHLVKWQFQPEKPGTRWQLTIMQHRMGISRLLQDSPSFKPTLDELAADAYSEAARLAAIELECQLKALPSSSPYSLEQLLDLDYLP